MDTDGFPLSAISEKSNISEPIVPTKRGKRSALRPTNPITDGDIPTSTTDQPAILEASTHSERFSTNTNSSKKFNQTDVTSIQDEDDDTEREERFNSQRQSQFTTDRDSTMLSSYTTGGENDVIEIHQFSLGDIDAYLDIYFETLDGRLRHYIGQNEQLQQFRVAMKTRINSNPNSREFQNVLLGKMNGEVLAAITMSFPGETPTIPHTSIDSQQNSCLASIRRWMTKKANYIPTNQEECYIEMIGVKSGYQNHGIGTAMLECVEQYARQAGATRLTVHTNGQRLQHYFERYGFNIDHDDNSTVWKWLVERQSSEKLSKDLTLEPENDYTANSYINESMTESIQDSHK